MAHSIRSLSLAVLTRRAIGRFCIGYGNKAEPGKRGEVIQMKTSRRDFLKYSSVGALGLSIANLPLIDARQAAELLLYIGTYTTGKSEGIYLYRLNLTTGELKLAGTTSHVINPSFLSLSPDKRYLYVVNEVDQ